MYESIHYYYAVVQIEIDMREALVRRYAKSNDEDVSTIVDGKLNQTDILIITQDLHRHIAEMNERNYLIHKAFLAYKKKPEIEKLRQELEKQTNKINSLHEKVISQ